MVPRPQNPAVTEEPKMCDLLFLANGQTIENVAGLRVWLAERRPDIPIAFYAGQDSDVCFCGFDLEGVCKSYGVALEWDPFGFTVAPQNPAMFTGAVHQPEGT
jgi:hypothetical protein